MSAAIISVLKKIAVYILSDKEKRGKLFVIVGSIIAGALGLMFLPIAVLSSIGSIEIEQLSEAMTTAQHKIDTINHQLETLNNEIEFKRASMEKVRPMYKQFKGWAEEFRFAS